MSPWRAERDRWAFSLRIALRIALALFAALAASGCRRASGAPLVARRVVSISASTTEALFAIGAGDRVVGRSRYDDYPKEALDLPTVGGFVDPNLEAILALRPDLVVGARGPLGPGFARTLDDHGIVTYFPETERFEQILAMIEGLGARTDHVDAAARVTSAMRARREAITAALSSASRPRVLLVFAAQPISVAGPLSFADEMITLAGGVNAMTTGAPYPMIALETAIALDPDVILHAEMGAGAAASLGGPWSAVRAVREGHVVHIEDEAVLRPGPRVLDGVAILARAIHPQIMVP